MKKYSRILINKKNRSNRYAQSIIKRLDHLIDKKVLENKYIVMFGANYSNEKFIEYLSLKGVRVDAVIDNDKVKQHTYLGDLEVLPPETVLGTYKDNALILIASQYYPEMVKQLERISYSESKHIVRLIHKKKNKYREREHSSFYVFLSELPYCLKGYGIYKKLVEKYGKDYKYFILPFNATGDIYIAGLYIHDYIKQNRIENYTVIVLGKACKSVAEMFDIKNIEVMDNESSDHLVRFGMFIGFEKTNMKVFHWHYHVMYTSFFINFEKYKKNMKINFADMFRYCIFEDELEKQMPKVVDHTDKIELIFREKSLQKGKTVIIAPYAQTFVSIPGRVWETLADRLIECGYTVCTNSIGEKEPAIKGTVPIFFELKDAIASVEYAGYFIGLRSGLCDVISSARCNKIIIYQHSALFASPYDYFSFKKMGLSEDVHEIEYYHYSEEELISQIVTLVLESK